MIQPGSLLMHVSVETDYKFPWWYFLHTGGIWQTNDTRSSEFAQSKVFLAPPLLFIVVLLTPSPQSSSAATTLVPLYTVVCSHSLNSSTRFSGSNIRNHTPRRSSLFTGTQDIYTDIRRLCWYRSARRREPIYLGDKIDRLLSSNSRGCNECKCCKWGTDNAIMVFLKRHVWNEPFWSRGMACVCIGLS